MSCTSISDGATAPINQHHGAAEISTDQVRSHRFAVSASHMQQGNVTALAETHTHTHTSCSPHTEKNKDMLFVFSH